MNNRNRNHEHDNVKLGLFFLLMAILFLFALVSPLISQTPDEIFKWKRSLVICNFNGRLWTTGFFITEDIIVTAFHLIPTIEQFLGKFPIYVMSYDGLKTFKADILLYNKSADVLLLSSREYKSKHYIGEFQNPKWGQECFILGFPQHWEWIVEGRIMVHLTSRQLGVNVNIFPGGSGSPVLSKDGKLLGMAVAKDRRTNSTLLTHSLYIKNGLKVLKENKQK